MLICITCITTSRNFIVRDNFFKGYFLMGEGDRGAGSLHFFVPGPRVRGGCGRSGNGSHAPSGEAGAEAGSLHFLCPTPGEGRLRRGRSGVRNGSEALSGGAARGRTARAKARARREFPGSPILSDSRGTLLYRCIAGRTTCSTCRHSSRRAPSGCGAVPRPAGP